jgi:hypothetical protein
LAQDVLTDRLDDHRFDRDLLDQQRARGRHGIRATDLHRQLLLNAAQRHTDLFVPSLKFDGEIGAAWCPPCGCSAASIIGTSRLARIEHQRTSPRISQRTSNSGH